MKGKRIGDERSGIDPCDSWERYRRVCKRKRSKEVTAIRVETSTAIEAFLRWLQPWLASRAPN